MEENLDEITCSVCFEIYDTKSKRPTFLPCHHTLCLVCMTILHEKNGNNTECPMCNQSLNLGEKGISSLAVNFYIMSKLEKMNPKKFCSSHSFQPKSFFCGTCEMAICRDCTVIDHKESAGHQLKNITEVVKEKRLDYNAIKDSASPVLYEATNFKKRIQYIKSQNESSRESEMRSVQNYCMSIVRYLDEKKTQILQEEMTYFDIKEAQLNIIDEEISSKAEILLKRTEERCEEDADSIIQESRELKKYISEIKDLLINAGLEKYTLKFEEGSALLQLDNSVKEAIQVLNSQTNIKSVIYLQKTTVFQQSFFIISFSSENKKTTLDDISVVLTDAARSKVPNVVSELSENQYKVCFTPTVVGEVCIDIHLKKCSMSISDPTLTVNNIKPNFVIGGPGKGNGKFDQPLGLAIDSKGFLFVADSQNRLIQKFSALGEFLKQFSIAKPETSYTSCLFHLLLDEQHEEIVCTENRSSQLETIVSTQNSDNADNCVIMIYDFNGNLKRTFSNEHFRKISDVAVNTQGQVIVFEAKNECIYIFDREAKLVKTIEHFLVGLCVDKADNMIGIGRNHCINILNSDGNLVQQIEKIVMDGVDKISLSWSVATINNLILVLDSVNHKIQIFKRDGVFIGTIDVEQFATQVVVAENGWIYVSHPGEDCISVFNMNIYLE